MDRHLEGSRSGRTCLRWVLAVLCGLFWAFAPQPARAQESLPHWYPLAGPAGRISHLAAAPNGDLYAVSVTGVNRTDDQTQWRETGSFIQSQALYRSEDGGVTWQPVTNDLPPGSFTALSVDDVRGDILVGLLGADAAADRRSPLWRSSDAGLHWSPLPLPAASPTANGLIIRQIARDADDRYLYLGATAEDESTVSYIYRSGDDGLTWTTFEVLRNDQQPGDILADVIPHPARGDRLFITTYAGDVLISEDAGQNWRSVVQRQAGIEAGVTPPQLAFRPDRPDVALAGQGAEHARRRRADRCAQQRRRPDLAVGRRFRAAGARRAAGPRRAARRHLFAEHLHRHISQR